MNRPSKREKEVCRRKVTYGSESLAWHVALKIKDKKLSPYRCPACGLWHLTMGAVAPVDDSSR